MKGAISKQRLLVAAFAAGALLAVSGWASATPMPVQHYSADLTALNGSGVSGMAHLTLNPNNNELTVNINAMGLEAGTHPEHIHGPLTNGTKPGDTPPTQATLPTVAADDGNTGQPTYGLI
jgi:hypothetical protein